MFLNESLQISSWVATHSFLIANSALAIIVIISMAIGKPFTLQYAREQVAREHWRNPVFLKINWVLTTIWAILMIVMAIPSYILAQNEIQNSWFYNYGLNILCILIGFIQLHQLEDEQYLSNGTLVEILENFKKAPTPIYMS